jgi:hypothetical protein
MAKSQGRFLAELLGSDGKVEKAKSDAGIYAGANVTIAADGTLTTTTLPLAGGALTGAVTTNSTFDGRDVAADGVTADAALPKAGGAMTGAITTNSTFDGVDIATRDAILTSTTTTAGAALPKAGGAMTGAITTNSTFDGVDIAARDAILTSTTTTAGAALPKAGGTMTGPITMSQSGALHNQFISTGGTSKLSIICSDSASAYINYSGATNEMSAGYDRSSSSFRFANADTLSSAIRMQINSAGNVGIGTDSPMSSLHVNKDIAGNNTDGITIGKVEANGWIDSGEEMGRLSWAASYGSSFTQGIGAYISAKADANWNGNEAPTRLGFFTAPENSLTPVERLTITKDGKVGIGTSDPSVGLDVYNSGGWGGIDIDGTSGGELQFQKAGVMYGQIYASNSHGFIINAQAGLGDIFFQSSGATKMTMLNSGNFGIGYDNPQNNIHILGSTASPNVGITLQSDDTANATASINLMSRIADNTNKTVVLSAYRGNLGITGDTNYGKVGIGTSTPDLPFHVSGTVALPATSGSTPVGMMSLRAKTANASHGLHMGVSNASPWGSWLQAQDANNLATEYPLLLNPNGGSVGIGVTAPHSTSNLQINDASDSRLIIYETGTSPYTSTLELASQAIGTYGALVQYTSGAERLTLENYGRTLSAGSYAGSIAFKTKLNNTTPTEVMFIHGFTGKVGIGTTSPDEALEIKGALKIKASANHAEASYLMFGRQDQGDGNYEHHIKSTHGSGTTQNKMSFHVGNTSATGRTNLLELDGGIGQVKLPGSHLTLGDTARIQLGTTWGTRTLYIQGGPTIAAQFDTTNGWTTNVGGYKSAAGGLFTTVAGNDLNLVYPTGRSIFIKEGSETHFSINNAGNVTIGHTAADNGILSIAGNKGSAGDLWSQVGPNNNASLIIQNLSAVDNTNAVLYFANDAGPKAAINARFINHTTDETELRFSTTGSSGSSFEEIRFTNSGMTYGNKWHEVVFGGTGAGPTAIVVQVDIDDKTTGQIFYVEAIFNHWNSDAANYTVAKKVKYFWTYSSTTSITEHVDGTADRGGSSVGAWTVDKPSNTRLRVTKSAGANSWPGEWYVRITSSCPITKV